MLKYGCRRASGAEILSAGTICSNLWTRSSVLPGSWSNLKDTEEGVDQARPCRRSPHLPQVHMRTRNK